MVLGWPWAVRGHTFGRGVQREGLKRVARLLRQHCAEERKRHQGHRPPRPNFYRGAREKKHTCKQQCQLLEYM